MTWRSRSSVFHQLPVLKTSTCSSGRLVPWAKVSSPAPPVGIAPPFIKYYRAARPAASASGSGPTGAPSRGLRRPENPQDRRPRHPAPLIRRFPALGSDPLHERGEERRDGDSEKGI